MTVAQFLNQTFCLQEEIEKLSRNIEALRILATSDTATLSSTPRSPSPSNSRMADIVADIADLEREKQDYQDRLLGVKREIIAAARQLSKNESDVIIERYISLLSWEEICEKLGYSRRQIQRVHQAATEKISVPKKRKKDGAVCP